jgi:hypothetical protein
MIKSSVIYCAMMHHWLHGVQLQETIIKCLFRGTKVIVEARGQRPTHVGNMEFTPDKWEQWIDEKIVTRHVEADCRALNIRVFAWGYEFECEMRLDENAKKKMPPRFTVTYINQRDDSSIQRIEEWCKQAQTKGGSIAVDTEGAWCDLFQIASDNNRGVLVIHPKAFCDSTGYIAETDLQAIRNLLLLPGDRSFIDLGGSDNTKMKSLFDRLQYEPSIVGDGMKEMARGLGFGFELKRDNPSLKARGRTNGKGSAKVFSEGFHNWHKRSRALICSQSDVDISTVMPGNASITLSSWGAHKCFILTLEQTTYAALDAWITLYHGLAARH